MMQDTKITLQQFELTSKLLGPDTKYRISRSDNHRVHDKKNLLSAESLKLKLTNSKSWTNYKIDPKSAPKDHTYIVLDYDDHGTNEVDLPKLQKSVHQYFGLTETFTVKTPSGSGFQEWYLIETDTLVNKIQKNNFQSIELPDKTLPIEIKTCLPGFNVTLEGPGTYRQSKSEYYTIIQETEPVKLSHKLISFLTKLSESERQRTVKKLEIRSRTADITEDSLTNITAAQNELIKYNSKYLFGIEKIEEHRNDYLYRMSMEIYTFNLSYEKGMEALALLQQSVFSPPLEDWEFEATTKSAFNRIRDARREFENSFDHIMEEFPKDDYGFVKIERDLYTARVEHLTSMTQNFMLSNNTNRKAFCETLIKTDESIYVPVKVSHKSFERAFAHEYNQYKQGTNPRFSVLFDALQKCSLYWKKLSYAEFNNNYVFIPEGGKNNKKVSGTAEFNNYSNVVHIIHEEPSAAKSKYILENGTANIGIKKDIEIPVESINDVEKKELEFFHNTFRRALTDEKNPEEYNFLLDRIALPLQHPNVNIDNVVAFYGKQGIGKTAFFTFISSLFNLDVVGIYPDFESFIAPHEEMKEMTLIEEVHLTDTTQTSKIWDKIKAISTSEMQHVNKKFIQSTKIARSINIFTTTNHLPDSLSMLEDRRLTLLYSPNPKIGSDIEESMKRIAKFLFGYPGAELRGLRVLYTDLINRKIKRLSWNYKPYFQKELCMELNADNKQLQCIMNYVANLGIVPNSDIRYPINEVEELEAQKNPQSYITNRYDHLIMFKYVYVNPYEFKDKIHSTNKEQLRNFRIGGWFNKHTLSSSFLSYAVDPDKRTTSHLLKDQTATFTMVYPSIKRTLKLMKEFIKVYGLEDHVQFLKDNENPTTEDIKEFLKSKYPEEEPGEIRLYNYLEIQTEEDHEW